MTTAPEIIVPDLVEPSWTKEATQVVDIICLDETTSALRTKRIECVAAFMSVAFSRGAGAAVIAMQEAVAKATEAA